MNLPPAIVVTGTGTDVGKTFASAALLQAFRAAGLAPLALKPVETGFADLTSDARTLATAAGHPVVDPLFTALEPISPHLATRRAHTQLRAQHIAEWVDTKRAAHSGPCLIETAGGLFSPLNDTETMLDVVRALEPCVFVVVAADRLGTLHDVSAAVHAAAALHRCPDAILLNAREPNTLNNATELATLGVAPNTLTLSDASSFAALCAALLRSSSGPVAK